VSESEEEKIVQAIPVPPMGFLAQVKKGVEVTFATKKAAMAAYALFFGVTVGTANIASTGMTAAERKTVVEMEEVVVTLKKQITELENVHLDGAHEHEIPKHEHPGLVALIDLSKESIPVHMHEFVPHSHNLEEHEHDASAPAFIDMAHDHPIDPELKAWFDSQADKFVIHEHDTTHTHKKAPSEEEANLSEDYKHTDSRHDTCARSCH